MKLGAMIWSERGKRYTKTGNEYIKINIIDEKRTLLAFIEVKENGILKIVIPSGEALKNEEAVFQMRNGNLKHGKKDDWCNECMPHGCKQL